MNLLSTIMEFVIEFLVKLKLFCKVILILCTCQYAVDSQHG